MGCREDVIKALNLEGDAVQDADTIVSELQRLYKQGDKDFRKTAMAYLDEVRTVEAKLVHEKILNLGIEEGLTQRLGEVPKSAGNYFEFLSGILSYSTVKFAGSGLGIKNVAEGYFSRFSSILDELLGNKELLKLAESGELDREIFTELFDRGTGAVRGTSGDSRATKIAKVYSKALDEQIHLKNEVGVLVDKRASYIMRQAHDPEKLLGKGKEAWIQSILPKLDMEKSFSHRRSQPDFNPVKALEEIFEEIVEEQELLNPNFNAGRSLQKKNISSRQLVFKDGAGAFDYNAEFGRQNLLESVIRSSDKAAHDAALVSSLGTNPDNMFENLLKKATRELEGTEKEAFKRKASTLRGIYNNSAGKTRATGKGAFSRFTDVLTRTQAVAQLNAASIRSISDFATGAQVVSELSNMPMTKELFSIANEFRKISTNKKEARELAKTLGYAFHEQASAFEIRTGVDEGNPGKTLQLQKWVFKLNGLEGMTRGAKLASVSVLTQRLAGLADKAFKDLPPTTQRELRTFDLADDWELLRGAVVENEVLGGNYRVMADEGIVGLDAPKAKKDKLRRNFAAMLRSVANESSPSPTDRIRNLLLGDSGPDSVERNLRRLATQYLSFPAFLMQYQLRRIKASPKDANFYWSVKDAFNFKHGGSPNLSGVALAATNMTILGLMADWMIDIANGKDPRDPRELETWKHAFLKGGAGSILADIALGDFNERGGEALIPGILGPAGQTFNTTAKILAGIRDGDPDAWEAYRLLQGSVPMRNLPGVKPLFDQFFLEYVGDALNPGYYERSQARARTRDKRLEVFGP